jgi:hypothetical protein
METDRSPSRAEAINYGLGAEASPGSGLEAGQTSASETLRVAWRGQDSPLCSLALIAGESGMSPGK